MRARHIAIVPCSDGSMRDVETFIDFLAGLSTEGWLTLGAGSLCASSQAAILDATLATQRLHFDAWLVRDSIETLVFIAGSSLPRPRRDHCAMSRARVAAERAALAILARPWLAASDFNALVSPISSSRQREWRGSCFG